jgi:riboflavin synthase
MFSGIIECSAKIREVIPSSDGSVIRIQVEKPQIYTDLHIGDSIACDGVCLTIETFDDEAMVFAIGHETMSLLGWKAETLLGRTLNLERSLRLGDRIHGHLVSGHVEALGRVQQGTHVGENLILRISVPESLRPYVWLKGSITIQGVSLTINQIDLECLSVCLIPETLKRTNLASLKVGDAVNLEPDYFAKGLMHYLSTQPRQQALESGENK